MLNLRDVLELVDDRLNNPTLSQQQLVEHIHQAILHVTLDPCDQLQSSPEKPVKQSLRDVPPVAKELSPELFCQRIDGYAVVNVAGRDAYVEQFAFLVCDQMKLEAKEPSGGSFSSLSKSGHHAMRVDAKVVTDAQRRRINEVDAGTVSFSRVEESDQGQQGVWNQFNEAVVAHELWELALQIPSNVPEIEVLEGTVVGSVEEHQDGHHFACAQARFAIGSAVLAAATVVTAACVCGQSRLFLAFVKLFCVVVEIAK